MGSIQDSITVTSQNGPFCLRPSPVAEARFPPDWAAGAPGDPVQAQAAGITFPGMDGALLSKLGDQ